MDISRLRGVLVFAFFAAVAFMGVVWSYEHSSNILCIVFITLSLSSAWASFYLLWEEYNDRRLTRILNRQVCGHCKAQHHVVSIYDYPNVSFNVDSHRSMSGLTVKCSECGAESNYSAKGVRIGSVQSQ